MCLQQSKHGFISPLLSAPLMTQLQAHAHTASLLKGCALPFFYEVCEWVFFFIVTMCWTRYRIRISYFVLHKIHNKLMYSY